jgi:metal-dependent amidase/aminoacylase/carboxypeptidase family protein
VIRHALGIPVAEIAVKMGVVQSVVFDVETRELSNTVMMQSIARMASAMGCKLVYGIVPEHGQTLENLSEERLWKEVLESRERENKGAKELKTGSGDEGTGGSIRSAEELSEDVGAAIEGV